MSLIFVLRPLTQSRVDHDDFLKYAAMEAAWRMGPFDGSPAALLGRITARYVVPPLRRTQ